MKPSIPTLLSFLLPLTLAATAHAQEPSAAAPQGVAAPAPVYAPEPPAPVYAPAAPMADLPPPPPPLMERRSEGLRVAGIVLIPIGSLALLGGVFVTTFGAFGSGHVETGDGFSAAAPSESGPSGAAVVGLTFMGVGAATLTGGIIMTVVGSKKVPVRTTEALAPAPRWSVEPVLGMGSAGFKGTF